jgi:hypothetical protein
VVAKRAKINISKVRMVCPRCSRLVALRKAPGGVHEGNCCNTKFILKIEKGM